MPSVAEKKAASKEVILTYLDKISDLAIDGNQPEGIKAMMLALASQLADTYTLSELKSWETHVVENLGQHVDTEN